MAQVNDTESTIDDDNVRPFPGAGPDPQPRARSRKKDRRAAGRRAKYRSKNKADRDAGPDKDVPLQTADDAPPIDPTVTQSEVDGVTPPARETASNGSNTPSPGRPAERQPRYASIPLAVVAYGFFGVGIGINIWNAWTGGPLVNMILPAAMGVLAESVMFFLPERTLSLPLIGKILAWLFLAFVTAFALTNSLRMASVISADQAMARADRQTVGTEGADSKLDKAMAARDQACARGLGKTVACQSRQVEVTKLEGKQTQATNKVASQAKPESADFARLVKWVSFGHLEPKGDDFDMLWLLFECFCRRSAASC
jgi:hypothetical protein